MCGAGYSRSNSTQRKTVVMIGNKSDLEHEVNLEEAMMNLAQELSLIHI